MSFFPQVIRVVKLKSANEISLGFTFLMFAGCLIWTAYAFNVNQLPMMVTSTTNTLLTGLILFLKCVYSRHPARVMIDTKLVKEPDTVVGHDET